jgi:hypothetical protein
MCSAAVESFNQGFDIRVMHNVEIAFLLVQSI